MNGGERIADVLHRQGVRTLFTLCGGHISPILVGANKRGIRVIDVRDEKNAVFAADATARLTGVPGVAAVTAGPGVTNTITAVKNAQLAHSPLVLLGGATATVLRNRGALQDIDQLALITPHVKWAVSVSRVKDLVPTLEQAFRIALEGVPGPVFVELPVDLLYDESTVREMYGAKSASDVKSVPDLAIQGYLRLHLMRTFGGAAQHAPEGRIRVVPQAPEARDVERARSLLKRAKRPVIVLGSQATLRTQELARTVRSIESLGAPVFLSGMARGLLGRKHPLWYRHSRGEALKQADFVLLAGVPNDFRLNYGLQINRRAKLVSVNLSETEATKNRRPDLTVVADPDTFLWTLADALAGELEGSWSDHHSVLRSRDDARELKIADQAREPATLVNPLFACRAIEEVLDPNSIIVADGGDFVGTASYIVAPRAPLSWLDPGVFGTLGVGAGFAAGAKVARPDSEVWILYGDGSVGFTINEMDTFVRHKLPVIAVVGNDAGWTQIARDQVVLLEDDVGTVLARSDYHKVAEGFGAHGIVVRTQAELPAALREAKEVARAGKPVLVNIHLDKSEFRKGSISM
ncbi:MAG: putative binding protein [Myxococcaceae bacterium]|nr:putative binding protein [Myxococcaceae bacterium]